MFSVNITNKSNIEPINNCELKEMLHINLILHSNIFLSNFVQSTFNSFIYNSFNCKHGEPE